MYTQTLYCRFVMVFVVCTLLCGFSVPPVSAEAGNTLYLPLVQAVELEITSTVVTTNEDEINKDGDCALREAIQATNTDQAVDNCLANAGTNLLILPAGIYTLTLAGAHEDNNFTGDLDITGTLTISGVGGSNPIINGNQIDRVLHVFAKSNVTLNHVTVSNGRTPDGADGINEPGQDSEPGGGIDNEGTLALIGSTMLHSSTGNGGAGGGDSFDGHIGGNSGNGGALFNSGILMIAYSNILNNQTGNGGTNFINACNGTARSQAGSGGGIYNTEGATVALSFSTIGNNSTGYGRNCSFMPGQSGGSGADGGGISNFGYMVLENSTVNGNQTGNGQNALGSHSQGGNGGQGGGILNGDTMRLINSTISGNHTGEGGGGLLNGGGHGGDGAGIANMSILTLTNVTISANQTGNGGFGSGTVNGRDGYGGGIYAESAARIINTLIGGNFASSAGADCMGTLKTYSFNLVQNTNNCALAQETAGQVLSQNPLLAPLADNGGPTWTHALEIHSPALDATFCSDIDFSSITRDQRDVARPQGGTCDIGSYERLP